MKRIYVWGFMGAGKSQIGRQLAEHLKYSFVDLDQLIEKSQQATIPEIFNQVGEPKFRQYETQLLRTTIQYESTIIATGGGTPCFNKNFNWMNNKGLTCYLKVPPQKLWERLKKGQQHRPLIQDLNSDELYYFIKNKLSQRAPYYEAARLILHPLSETIQEMGNRLQSA